MTVQTFTESRKRLAYAVIFTCAFLTLAWQFIHPGYYNVYYQDAAMLPKYVLEFKESFRQGIFYPRWMADDVWGYGSPVFVLYSPLLYFIASVVSYSNIGLPLIISTINLAVLCIGGIFLFRFLKDEYGYRAALIAAIFYVTLPSRVYEIYFLNTPAGRFGEVFLPMALFFARKVKYEPFKRANFTGLAFSYSGLVISHLATAFLFTPFLLAYVFVTGGRKTRTRVILQTGLALGTGLLLSSFFFLPVLLERALVQINYLSTIEVYQYWRHLVFTGPPRFRGKYLDMVYLGLKTKLMVEAGLLLAIVTIIQVRQRSRPNRETYFFLTSVIFCLFMMSFLSGFLWENIPALKVIVFPTRFLPVYLVFMPAMLGIAADSLLGLATRPRLITVLHIALLTLVPLSNIDLMSVLPKLADKYVMTFIHDADFQLEYLPKGVYIHGLDALETYPRISSHEQFKADVARWGYVDRSFNISAPHGARLRVKTFYFPGWKAWVDDDEIPISVEGSSGAMLLDVPAGRHYVRLRFMDTPPRAWGKAISLITLVALVLPYGAVRRRRHINP